MADLSYGRPEPQFAVYCDYDAVNIFVQFLVGHVRAIIH